MTDRPEDRWYDEAHEDLSDEELYDLFLQNPELIRESLYRFGFTELPSLPELAREWLTELADVGLNEPEPDRHAHFKQSTTARPMIDPQDGELRPVRVGIHRRVFWLKVDGSRTSRGYKNIEVLDKPLRTQTAIIALLTVLEANPIDVDKLREALSEVDPPLDRSVSERWAAAWWGLLGDEGFGWNEKLQRSQFRYVLALLRHYRPDFDELPLEEQLSLLSGTSERVNKFLTTSRQLVEFLEYGSPDQDLREAAEDANRDVRAAVLKDVEGLTLLQIAERFGLSVTQKQRDEWDPTERSNTGR